MGPSTWAGLSGYCLIVIVIVRDLRFPRNSSQITTPSGLQPSDLPSVRIGLRRDLGAGELQ
eukprot:3462178-Prymnesium_polylepis.1